MADREQELKKTKELVTSILTSEKYGLSLPKLEEAYYDFVGDKIPYQKLGFSRPIDFFRAINDAVRVSQMQGEIHLDVVMNDKIATVRKLVERQRDPAKKGRRGGRRGAYGPHRGGRGGGGRGGYRGGHRGGYFQPSNTYPRPNYAHHARPQYTKGGSANNRYNNNRRGFHNTGPRTGVQLQRTIFNEHANPQVVSSLLDLDAQARQTRTQAVSSLLDLDARVRQTRTLPAPVRYVQPQPTNVQPTASRTSGSSAPVRQTGLSSQPVQRVQERPRPTGIQPAVPGPKTTASGRPPISPILPPQSQSFSPILPPKSQSFSPILPPQSQSQQLRSVTEGRSTHTPSVPAAFRGRILDILIGYPNGLLLSSFETVYEKWYHESISFQRMGFYSCHHMLSSLPDIVELEETENDVRIHTKRLPGRGAGEKN